MRIVGGEFKGRSIKAPDSSLTRPVTDKTKEAVFNMLGDISDLTVLDAYSGSGALALEAISRGASSAVAIDNSKEAIRIINDNVAVLDVSEKIEVVNKDVAEWLEDNQASFDLVFADPPFSDANDAVLKELMSRADRLFILKHARRKQPLEVDNLELVRSRKYGESMISIYKIKVAKTGNTN